MRQQNKNGSTRRIGDVLEDVIQEQSIRPRPMGTDGLRTGLRALDDVLGDLPYCETVGVVGRCEAVTDTLLTIARNAALKGASVLYCTRGSVSRAAAAIVAHHSRVSFASLFGGSYDEGEVRALDRAIEEIGGWDIRFAEYDDGFKDFPQNLYRAITQKLDFSETLSNAPKLIVVDSLLDMHMHEGDGSLLAETLDLLDEISTQWRATMIFGFAGEHCACSFDSDSALRSLAYATIKLREHNGCGWILRPEFTVLGELCSSNAALIARNLDFRCVVDVVEFRSVDSERRESDSCTNDVSANLHGQSSCSQSPFFIERLMRYRITQTATPFTGQGRETTLAERDRQWTILRSWVHRGQSGMPLDPLDFEAFIAYETGFEKEADSFYRSKGLCKTLHDRVMARVSCTDGLENQLLLALLSAFVFMDEHVNGVESERPTYRLRG